MKHAVHEFLLGTDSFTEEQLGQGVNCTNLVQDSPLIVACNYQIIDAVQHLIALGADLNWQGEFGFSPLHCAVYRGNSDLVRVLLRAGADWTITDHAGETPLELARSCGKLHIADLMVSLGYGAA
ncbi:MULTISPECIES: ankyrin repeat domain-containing protein [unclassified Lysobacter]|uniref:ankyrin repeat domain-containing protein n=1 Tax=unclassified Lysobacter TaxID=2635362 RepID=UPI0006F56F37|nr:MULTISPECIES: ankyrin repeat domain-containing protein [unclassified Lysobacter]KQZ66202.1 hypothetical protein ASD53_17425 [Lysobacter sp. Root559]KRC32230.1 hypothetical protein ASE10_16970 [Lysobacter sp. Root76]KRD67692.1 hypothetical protein ASE45_13145 [Lysobacter sp. Root96]